MSFAILRTSKLKTWGGVGGSATHTYRQGSMAPNADPSRTHLNVTLVGVPGEVVSDVKRRVDAITDKPRANAVLAVEVLCAASPEWFEGKSEQEIDAWAKRNVRWLQHRFGKENVVHAVLHCDESTPHIVAYIVPEAEGRLNCRALLGGRERLSELQTAYAAAMAPLGLQRGVQGSKAEHVPVKLMYAEVRRLGAAAEAQLARLGTPEPPPVPPLLSGREARTVAQEAWTARERARTEKLVQRASGAFLAASLAKGQARQLKDENGRAVADVQDLRIRMSEMHAQLGLTKDQVSALRTADVSLVATRLGHMGEVKPKENAIDLVRRVNRFDFGQAVAWLHHEIGPILTGALVTAVLQDREPARPSTPAENVMKRAIAQQTDALGCDKYRLTLVPADETKRPYLPGKPGGKASVETFYTRTELADLVPWLRFRNNQGDNVFITPMDDNAFYILLDDAKVTQEQLVSKGFEPCLIQNTSWSSQQAVFKVPKSVPREDVIRVFNEMNKTMGDADMTGLRHPFRLAGFRNMKPKHLRQDGLRPFVEVVLSVNRFCTKCMGLVRHLAAPISSPTAPRQGHR